MTILIVAATREELAPLERRLEARLSRDDTPSLELRVVGAGKAACALATERAAAALGPSRILMIGCAGAFAAAAAREEDDARIATGDVVIGDEEVFADDGVLTDEGFLSLGDLGLALGERAGERIYHRVPLDVPIEAVIDGWSLRLSSRTAIPYRILRGRLATVSAGSGTDASAAEIYSRVQPLAETLEGAAAALVAWTRELPFTEIRGISNLVGRRDRASWDIDLACERAAEVAELWLDSLEATARAPRASIDRSREPRAPPSAGDQNP